MSHRNQLIVFLFVSLHVLGQATRSANYATEKGLKWCGNFCLCPQTSEERLQCINNHSIYSLLDYNEMKINRLDKIGYNPIATLKWCDSGSCLCNKDTDKAFDCIKNPEYLIYIINEASTIAAEINTEAPSIRFAGMVPDMNPNNENELNNEDLPYSKRYMDQERRNHRRQNRRNNRRGRKKNRHEDESEINDGNISYEGLADTEESAFYNPYSNEDNSEYTDHSMLPKHEARNSNPMVTALKPSTRRQPASHPTTTVRSMTPPQERNDQNHLQSIQKSVHPDFQPQSSNAGHANEAPVLEVPIQRKTVAGQVSKDLQQITEDVQHIRSDVVFNQRILLVTVGVAGIAMIG